MCSINLADLFPSFLGYWRRGGSFHSCTVFAFAVMVFMMRLRYSTLDFSYTVDLIIDIPVDRWSPVLSSIIPIRSPFEGGDV